MKKLKKTVLILILLFYIPHLLYSAKYLGKNIDGVEYDCTAYSYDTGNYYYVTVEFYGDEATITFSNGGYITITLDNEEIENPNSISCYDYNRSIYWDLDVYNLD